MSVNHGDKVTTAEGWTGTVEGTPAPTPFGPMVNVTLDPEHAHNVAGGGVSVEVSSLTPRS